MQSNKGVDKKIVLTMINDRRMDQNKNYILYFYKVGTEQWVLTIAENHHSHNMTN